MLLPCNNLNQYFVSLASFEAIEHLVRKSFFVCHAIASSILAQMLVQLLSTCLEIINSHFSFSCLYNTIIFKANSKLFFWIKFSFIFLLLIQYKIPIFKIQHPKFNIDYKFLLLEKQEYFYLLDASLSCKYSAVNIWQIHWFGVYYFMLFFISLMGKYGQENVYPPYAEKSSKHLAAGRRFDCPYRGESLGWDIDWSPHLDFHC